mmetsp:Transcript_47109/g.71250  ORF Transcript_47109/g.71250 Transcript_47109/m.71250 type:complete len:154 (-) Transcript_47109:336-797(-)
MGNPLSRTNGGACCLPAALFVTHWGQDENVTFVSDFLSFKKAFLNKSEINGSVNVCNESHPSNAPTPMFFTVGGNSNSSKLRHSRKASSPISSVPSGTFKYFNDLHLWNALLPIFFKVDGSCTSTKLKQSRKTPSSTASTPSGMAMEVSLLHL